MQREHRCEPRSGDHQAPAICGLDDKIRCRNGYLAALRRTSPPRAARSGALRRASFSCDLATVVPHLMRTRPDAVAMTRSTLIELTELTIDINEKTVRRGPDRIPLTPLEYRLF